MNGYIINSLNPKYWCDLQDNKFQVVRMPQRREWLAMMDIFAMDPCLSQF
jgi:hypothetical protein